MLGFRFAIAPLSALAVFAASALVVWSAYLDAGNLVDARQPPLVKAATTPLKRSPTDPGGRTVAELGGVGDLINETPGDTEERLLPSPERPVTPSEAASTLTRGERVEAAAALEALVSEIRSDDGGSGAGGPNPDDDVAFPAPTRPERPVRTAQSVNEVTVSSRSVQEDAIGSQPSSQPAAETELAALTPTFETTSGGRFRIQLAAVREESDAERAWELFRDQLDPFISGLQPFFEKAETSNGVFYRVQIGPFAESDEADRLCAELKKQNASCFVVAR